MGSFFIWSGTTIGLQVLPVKVEVDVGRGLPGFSIIGLGDAGVQEAKDRIRAALRNSGFEWPRGKVTINLSPANVRKTGTHLDLAMAFGILVAQGIFTQQEADKCAVFGELGLGGKLEPITNAFLYSEWANKMNFKTYVPAANLSEARLANLSGMLFGVESLAEFVECVKRGRLADSTRDSKLQANEIISPQLSYPDLGGVIGQETAKRALMISVVGKHHLLMSGPPGSGKTMLASAYAGLLPEPNRDEQIDIWRISSHAKLKLAFGRRPLRAPHHTASSVALIGGGRMAQPGEITLAHRGVLFLDELPEFNRSTIEALREPLQNKTITISRAEYKVVYPADFILIAAMNPCPCGFYGDSTKECVCYPKHIAKYQARISGPLLDRLDLHIKVSRQSLATISSTVPQLSTAQARSSIEKALAFRRVREQKNKNQALPRVDSKALAWLQDAGDKLNISARSYHKCLAVGRSIADLEGSEVVRLAHLQEALFMRLPG